MSLYHNLHASTHNKEAPVKVLHSITHDNVSHAWITPEFEFYCVAGPNVSRASLKEGTSQVIKWVKREEQRIFIIGGAAF